MKSLFQYVVPAILFVAVLGLSAEKIEAECGTPESFQTEVRNLGSGAETDFEFDLYLKAWQTIAIPYAGLMFDVEETGTVFVNPVSVSANPDWTNFVATSCTGTDEDVYLFTITGDYEEGTCPGGGANLNLKVRLYRDTGYITNVQACNVGCP